MQGHSPAASNDSDESSNESSPAKPITVEELIKTVKTTSKGNAGNHKVNSAQELLLVISEKSLTTLILLDG